MDRELAFVEVTGTNGKTTTTSLIANIVACAGEVDARVTTLGSWVAGECLAETTDTDAFTRCLSRAQERGARTLCVETTSKALAEGFAQHYPANVAVLTSFSRDHLDYHGSPEQYLAAKAQLFMTLRDGGTAVFDADCEAAALLEEVTPRSRRRAWFSLRAGCSRADLIAARLVTERSGTRVELAPTPLGVALGGELRLRLLGEPFVADALAAALAAHALGYSPAAIRAGLESFAGVPGRFQRVCEAPLVVVDYAHTPDALEQSLRLARTLAPAGRVFVVFGCGGERDRGKRPLMGRVAAELADWVVLTNDNPRSEDPTCILQEIADGCRAAGAREEAAVALGRMSELEPRAFFRIPSRGEAIGAALPALADEDVVLIAGKGHEQVQWIGSEAHPCSDVALAVRALEACGKMGP